MLGRASRLARPGGIGAAGRRLLLSCVALLRRRSSPSPSPAASRWAGAGAGAPPSASARSLVFAAVWPRRQRIGHRGAPRRRRRRRVQRRLGGDRATTAPCSIATSPIASSPARARANRRHRRSSPFAGESPAAALYRLAARRQRRPRARGKFRNRIRADADPAAVRAAQARRDRVVVHAAPARSRAAQIGATKARPHRR